MDAFEKKNFAEKNCFTTRFIRVPISPVGFKVLLREVWTCEETSFYPLYKLHTVWRDTLTDIRNQDIIVRDVVNERFRELCWSKCL